MAARRKRARKPVRTVSRVAQLSVLDFGGSDGGGGDPDLLAAAKIIAQGARDIAGTWSQKIPRSIYTTADGNVATVHAAAPDARPAEFRLRHPLFGDREHWYGPPGAPFLAPALDVRIDQALRRYADSADTWAKKHGWS